VVTLQLRTPIADPVAPLPVASDAASGASEEAVRLALRLRDMPCAGPGGRTLLFLPASPDGDTSRIVDDAVRGLLELHEGPLLVADLRATSAASVDAPDSSRSTPDAFASWEAPSPDLVTVAHPFAGRHDLVAYAASQEFAAAIDRAQRRYAFVLAIGDALRTSVETLIAAARCDGVILAVTPGRTTRTDVQRTAEQLRRGRAHVAGFVVEARSRKREV
jgi:hypothetical protein